jgi:hypothetical protein
MRTPHAPFTLAEAVKVIGGKLIVEHGHNCASRRTRDDADCRCLPNYRLWRIPAARKGGR